MEVKEIEISAPYPKHFTTVKEKWPAYVEALDSLGLTVRQVV